ncbi:hypothetical protein A3J17_03025 [Candidatus Curtissbacteria bacterium RIFCSPLOWO2_02_FULL_40_11]|uniref:Uncharacterized protein n=2 Tax=Candidatus Curtissiibacteriota TaxID=1752717 RepID=A0A1F5GC72_9BACT|nr:MAG: hypothetical protein A3D04_04590 [Candidatus Curtissbacteria bacterium RIFCSPHIGHO2_02_FULL_40_16b]OGE00621.1 MAG: hypothetical protein A3J17_03025 [Candidatus Curtissbacteria bacterium RIFCSPLOWO2_02_FULL_40_11]OGE13602.1 MAG: hypothetical protein A3G14_02825 [Candidatus Curtissbacteria bacterium RIFCSPLOWO2_12_FULL_38_9]
MQRGFVHLIPVILVAVALLLGATYLITTQRTKTLEKQVLSSSNVNESTQQISDNKGDKPTNIQPTDLHSQSQSSNNKNTGSTSQSNTRKNTTKIDVNSQAVIKDSSPTASPTVNPGRKIRTNFPITVNPATGEKIVTTPSGTHVVILPEVAIQNMIRAGFPVVLPPEPSPSPTSSPEATASATPEATASATSQEGSILLTELNNQLVYEIPAVKKQKFLGVLPVDVRITGYVSAENGSIITTKKSFFNKILDALSF